MTFDSKGNYIDDCPGCELGGDTRGRIQESNAVLSLGEDGMQITPDPQPECRLDEHCEQCGVHLPPMEGCTDAANGLFCSAECMKDYWDNSNEQPVIPEPPEYDPADVAFRRSQEVVLCVYISGPMTGDGTPEEMRRNVMVAWEIFKRLIKEGYSPLCPHFSGLMPDHGDLTREEWVANDLHWVERADAVLRLHGDSDGADDEVLHATHCRVPVFSAVEQLEEWRDGRLRRTGQ